MLVVRKTPEGYIWAYVIYHIVDQYGMANEKATYCFVEDIWIHSKYRNLKTLQQIVREEHSKYPQVETIYYTELKHNKRWKIHKIRSLYS